jgi:hypothetical protein
LSVGFFGMRVNTRLYAVQSSAADESKSGGGYFGLRDL